MAGHSSNKLFRLTVGWPESSHPALLNQPCLYPRLAPSKGMKVRGRAPGCATRCFFIVQFCSDQSPPFPQSSASPAPRGAGWLHRRDPPAGDTLSPPPRARAQLRRRGRVSGRVVLVVLDCALLSVIPVLVS